MLTLACLCPHLLDVDASCARCMFAQGSFVLCSASSSLMQMTKPLFVSVVGLILQTVVSCSSVVSATQ